MVSREQIEIILKAEDQASQIVKQNEQQIKKFGDAAKESNDKASQASQQMQQKMQLTNKEIDETTRNVRKIGRDGSDSFRNLTESQQDAVIKFNMLDQETQKLLQDMNTISRNGLSGLGGAINDAKSKFQSLDGVTKSWSGSLDYSKSKLQLLGADTDSLKGKIQVVGNGITTYLGTKWDAIKPRITSLGSHITGSLGNAVSTVKSKIQSLGQSFSGLGGIISSAIGGLGMASIGQLTVGLSLSREKMSALNAAIMGSKDASDAFLDSINTKTNTSVLAMDQVVTAMNKIKLSTQISNEELANSTDVVMKLGEASTLMGNDAETAAYQMGEAFSGLNGDFQILKENFGITKEKMEAMGWSGSADDVAGYREALGKCLEGLGDLGGVMDTNAGKLEQVKKKFRSAGRTLGDMFTPYLGQAADAFLQLEGQFPGMTQGLIGVAGGVSMFATVAPSINGVFTAVENGMSVLKGTGEIIRGVGSAIGIMSSAEELAGAAAGASAAGHAAAATAEEIEAGAAAGAAVSTWALVWPVLAVIAAIAGIAIVVYEAGKAFGWWNNVGDMVGAITSGIKRLWEAFINNPDVQGVIQAISDAWAWLAPQIEPAIQGVLKFLGVSSDGNFDIVHAIIMAVGSAFHNVANMIRAAIPYLQAAWGFLSWLVGSAIGIGQGIYNALKPIVCILLGCSPGIVPALQSVYEWFMTVWNAIAEFLSGIIPTVITTLQPIIDILTMIGEFIITQFMESWNALVNIITIVWNSVNMLILVFQSFMSGQISLSTALTMVWNIISTMFASVLSIIIQRVISFGSSLVNLAISIARNFVNNIIKFISTLPGRFASYLIDVIGRIASAGASWISTAGSKASSVVSSVMNYISQLPGKVYQEFMNIGSRMLEAGSQLVEKAKQVGQSIVDGLLGAMGIHSPGIIQEKVVGEFVDMVDRIKDRIKSAKDTAKTMGEAIVDGFGNPTLETDTSNILPNYDALKTGIGVQAELAHAAEENPTPATTTMDTTSVSEGNEEVIGSYDNLAALTGAALQSMVERDKLAYDTMRTNDATTLFAMSTNLQQKMSLMSNNVTTSMNNIVSKNQSSMNTVNNTTKSHLNSIVSKTKSANDEMIQSWEVMKNGIIKAADKIRSDSTNHFNKLSNTIGDFYGKLKNPSRWGAGSPMSGSRPSRSSRGFGKITQAIQNATLPKYLSLSQLKNNPMIQSGNFGDYVIRDNKSGMFNVSDLLKYGAIKLGIGAGAYDDIPSPHVRLIKDTSNEWDMSGPLIGPYSTSKGFKVKEFLEGVPRIAYDTFRQIAEEVYSQTDYEFYYDDDHHGNWINAFNAGSMNCKHGAESIIAMANAMGLSGYMQHGHWDEYGHYFAVIEGHKMDVTGWQQRRTWTPSASAGPAPKRYGFKEFIEDLKNLFKDDDPKNNGGGLRTSGDKIVGEFTIIHDFRNLPEGISAEEVAKLVEDSTTNEGFLKRIAQHPIFQEYDLREKSRIERQNNRARGV